MRVDKDVYVAMRDGVGLAIDLYSPEPRERHAALLTMTPYSKDPVRPARALDATGRRIPFPGSDDPLPDVLDFMPTYVAPFVDAGFVVAVADARGTGFSEGLYDYYNLQGGSYDGYDLVEWLAAQPWCSGIVGVMGFSAGAVYSYLTALTGPPHLAAMVANMHPGDFYFDQWRVGGVFRWDSRLTWALAIQNTTRPIDPGDPAAPAYDRKRAVYESRMREVARRVVQGKGAVDLDWLTDLYHRDRYEAYWRGYSLVARASQITIPTLNGGVWYDHFIRGTLNNHAAIEAPKRLIVGPGQLVEHPEVNDGGFAALSVAWFEHFLLDVDNGVEDSPAARIYLTGEEQFIDLESWPMATVESEVFLRSGPSGVVDSVNDGVLSPHSPVVADPPDELSHDPESPVRTPLDVFDQRDFERSCLTFTSQVLDEDLVVIGSPKLFVYATTDAPDVDLCVRLCDVDEAGRSRLLNTGALKGSHVASHTTPTAMVANQVYCFEIEIWSIANVFRQGHRIRLDVAASDFPLFEINAFPSRIQIHHDPERPSRLVLPVARLGEHQSPGKLPQPAQY